MTDESTSHKATYDFNLSDDRCFSLENYDLGIRENAPGWDCVDFLRDEKTLYTSSNTIIPRYRSIIVDNTSK